MNNLYNKVAITSICTALTFTLVTNKEAKAATITLRPTNYFYVVDINNDGLGDGAYGNMSLIPVGRSSTFGLSPWEGVFPEFRAFYGFNIASLSLTSNTIITNAIFQTTINSWEGHSSYFALNLFGYQRNGDDINSDFEAGTYLGTHGRSPWPRPPNYNFNLLNIDATPFVNELVSNNDALARFNMRTNSYARSAEVSSDASLIITTADVGEPVPEPTTIFGSAIALGVGGWLKRKKSSQ
jgi:hypothetical protein